jgi:uncharacterized protein (TIRG00374 family)
MNRGSARLLRYISALVALGVLLIVIVTAKPAEVWDALQNVEGTRPWVVIALNLVVIALFTARSQLILARMGHAVPLQVLVPASILGNVAGALTPGGSGEILRAAALQRSAGLRLADAVTLVAYERVLSTYLLLLSTLACLAATNLDAAPATIVIAVCAALVLLPWLCAVVILPRLPKAETVQPRNLMSKVLRYGLQLAAEIRVLLTNAPLLVAWSALTVCSFAVVALQFELVARSLGVPLSFLDGWIAFGGSGVASILSLLPLGVGIGDGSIAAIIQHAADVPFDLATATAVLIRATVTLPLIALAVLSYFYLLRFTAEMRADALAGDGVNASSQQGEELG